MSLRWTEQDFEDWRLRKGAHAEPVKAARQVEAKRNANLIPGPKPKGGMNKWETQFAMQLEHRKQAGELIWWEFEPFRIRLAEGAFYRPDFVSVDREGRTAIYEVKGYFREAARVRLKVAAEKLPYPFYIVRKNKGELEMTRL